MTTTTPTVHPAARRRSVRWPRATACAALALALAAPASAQFFPTEPSVVVFDDDFAPPMLGNWTGVTGSWATRNTPTVSCGLQGAYGDYAYEASGAPIVNPSLLLIDRSVPGNPGYDPVDWTNLRLEVDLHADADHSQGLVWHGTPDSNLDGRPDDYYMFVITPGTSSADPAWWTLVRRENDVDAVIGSAAIHTGEAADEDDTVVDGHCYRIRLEWACGNLRVQIRRQEFFAVTTEYGGCGVTCGVGDPEACWCTVMQWTDTSELNPGFAGLAVADSTGVGFEPVFDNVTVRAWPDSCFLLCDAWSGWTEIARDTYPMKFLYEGAVLDFDYGRDILQGRIDVATESPTAITPRNATTLGFCNGWKMLVDLPTPLAATDNLDAIRSYLQPMHTAVDYVSASGTFSWQDDFDNDSASASYNPIPMVADGSTPIANAMYDAYQWYKTQRTTGPWSGDPLADCRFWYVVLITDGEQACGRASDYVCQAGEAADLFANPDVVGLDPVPVFTIGFSEDVSATSPLACIADYSDQNDFFTAANAAELTNTLYEVFNRMDPVDRSFVPFKVSPPPSSAGGASTQQDFLSVFPFFVPKNTRTIWDGTLYAFVLNEATPTLPATGDCEINFADSRLKWDANSSMAAQFTAGYSDRRVYIGDAATGDWARRSMMDITTDALLRADFETGLDVSSGVTLLETQEVLNFVRNIRDTTLDGAAQSPPRPVGVSVLGDVYHSQPVIIGPPNDPQYYYDYGFEDTSSTGMAGQYRVFTRKHAQRRRVVLAGANDGMLHAFDAGYYDRDDGGTYDDIHDPGNGKELFAFTPRAVWDRLHYMTYGEEHQYMVDGHTVTGDVFIDHDDDGTVEWRTVAITGMRRGGRGYVALDLTQPDVLDLTGFSATDPTTFGEVTTWTAGSTDLPTCEDGTTAGCGEDYPYLLWEFADTADADGNCGAAPDCTPYQDLGWTWSRPAIARLAVYNSSDPAQPDSQFVAFFGGGWDETETDSTGNFIYAVDLEDGTILYKQNIGVSVPGSVRALDSDLDGFHDRVYFGDTDGSIWRIAFPAPNDSSNNGITSAELLRLWDFRSTLSGQEFYAEPITVPALFNGGDYTWALAIGSGDRANLGDDTAGTAGHFFFLLDTVPNSTTAPGTPKGTADLDLISYATLGNLNSAGYTPGADSCGASSLDPANSKFGWYLELRANEKVNFEASVVNGFVNFPTFEPGDGLSATDPPDVCAPTGTTTTTTTGTTPTTPTATTPTGTTPTTTGTATTAAPVCTAAGIGRIYKLWFECATARESGYQEVNDIITGSETYTIGGETYVSFTGSTTSLAPTLEYPNVAGNIITNWRQR